MTSNPNASYLWGLKNLLPQKGFRWFQQVFVCHMFHQDFRSLSVRKLSKISLDKFSHLLIVDYRDQMADSSHLHWELSRIVYRNKK